MKTRLKKTLSVLLTLCMILSVMSSSLIAVGASESAEPVSNDTVISDTESADGADTVTMPEGMTEGDPQTPPSDEPTANTEGEDSLAPTDPADSTDPAAPEDESGADTPEDEGIGMPGEEQNEDDVNNDVQAEENDDPSYDEGEDDGFLPGEPEEGEGEDYGIMLTLANAASGMMWSVNGSNPIETPYRARNLSGMVAFDFHIFAKEANVGVHCNGNIATDLLNANANFGIQNEGTVSYIGSATAYNSASTAAAMVFGPEVPIQLTDNGNSAEIGLKSEWGGYVKLDKPGPDRVYSAKGKYIDIDAGLSEVAAYAATLASKPGTDGLIFNGQDWNNAYLDASAAIGNPVVWNVKYDEINDIQVLNIKGISNGRTLIINVTDMPYGDEAYLNPEIRIDGGAQNGEAIVAWDGNLIWNFGLFAGTVKTQKAWLGTMLAPCGNLDVGANGNGSLIAQKVTTRGETHKWDFGGFDKDTTTVSGSKTWVLPSEYTPEEFKIKVTLYRTYYIDGVQVGEREEVSTQEIIGDGTYSFGDLPLKYVEYADTEKTIITRVAYYRYEVKEEITQYPEGINLEDIKPEKLGYNFVNTVKGNSDSSVSGTKTWKAPEGTELPESITVTLYQNGRIYNNPSDPDFKNPQIVTKDNGWHYEWTNLPTQDKNGLPYTYYVDEDVPDGWIKTIDGYNITNTKDGTPRGSLKVVKKVAGNLNGDSEEIQNKVFTFTVTGPDGFNETFAIKAGESKEFDNLTPGDYTVTEVREGVDVDGYTCEVTGEGTVTVEADLTATAEVTNTYTAKPGSLKVVKTVAGDLSATDEEIQNKVFTFTVTGPDGSDYEETVTLKAGETKTLDNLVPGTYIVTENKDNASVSGYKFEASGEGRVEVEVKANNTANAEVTNTYTKHKEGKTSVFVEKKWVDPSNGDKAPDGAKISVQLLRDGEPYRAPVELPIVGENGDKSWSYTFDNLELYKNPDPVNPVEYTYSVKEVKYDDDDWTSEFKDNSNNSFTITNTRKLGSLELTKTVVGLEIADAKTYTFDVKGPEGYVGEIVINISDNGIGTGKLENLVPGEYTITERDASVEGYALKVEGDKTVTVAAEAAADASVTNTYTALTTVSGTKTWVDASNDNKAPDTSITVQLLRDGDVIDSKTVTAADNWKYEFTNLPKTDAEGNAYTYTVDETAIPGWTKSITGYNITNTRDVVSVSGTKTWVDASNDNKAPDTSITVQLLRDGTVIDSKTVTAADNWKYEFTNLPKTDAEGNDYTYSVDETAIPGWTKSITGDDITNTREVVSVSGTKTWVDASNDNKAPDTSITVQLLRDGEVIDSKTVTAADNWKYEFTNLPKTDAEGNDYTYSVDETAIPGWTKAITGYNITNTRTVVFVEGTKTWHSATGAVMTSVPDSYSVDVVVKNGETEVGRMTLSNANGWDYKFENLPEYDAAGNKITYTVSEENAPEHWTSKVDGYNISNTMEGTEITAAKTWNTRGLSVTVPESVTLKVLADGEDTGITIELSEANDWSATRGGLNKYDITDGHEIKYTVEEVPITGWTPSYDGNNVTNTYDVTSVTAKKVWNKADGTPADAADEIPASVQVDVLADGVLRDTMTLMASNSWTSTLGNLPKYAEDGDEIVYTVKEHTVDGWVSAVTNDGNVYTVTNTKKVPEKGAITLTKQVIGGGAAAADKEYSFEINGPDGYSQTVTVTGAGSISLTDLEPGEYTVTEVGGRIGGYRLDVTGDNTTVTVEADGEANVVITNEYTELRDVEVTKEWYVNGSRTNAPAGASITVSLYADGVATGDSAILSQYTDWKAEFTGLDVYDEDGNEIRYTVAEVYVSGWTSTVVGTADTGFVIRNYSTYTPPHEPEQPDQPDEPEQPDEPDEPETPETPETPDIPHEPEQPRQPEQPREPERPFTPEMPETPEVPFYDIPDSEVPLTHITDSKTPLVDIPDLGVPLRALPATGDESHTVVWMAIMVCSAFGIIVLAAVLYFDGKKNKKREESAE